MNNSGIKILTWFVVAISLIVSLYIGAKVAEGNYFNLGLCFALVAGTFYAFFINKYWIFISLAIASFAVRIQPIGPALDAEHLAILLAAGFIFSNFWKKVTPAPSERLVSKAFVLFDRAFLVFTLYLLLHAYVTYYYPAPGIVVAFGNLAKQYFSFWSPFAILWTTTRFIRFIPAVEKPHTWIGLVFLFGITFNIILRVYASFFLGSGERDLVTQEIISPSALFIPVLNLTDNIYALRGLSPLVALFGIAMLTSKNKSVNKKTQNFLWVLLLVLGVVGSLVSMGRATIAITIFLIIVCLLVRKKIAAVALMFLIFVFLIVGTRIAYEADRDYVPFGLQRSLAMIPGMDMPEAEGDIDASSNWRWLLATSAFDEWKSNSRKFFIGRGVHAFTERDLVLIKLQGYFGAMDVALRRGTTHNIVTDLLITVGLLGTILYVFLFVGFIVSIIKIIKLARYSKNITYDTLFMCLLFSISMIPVYILGGGGVYNTVVLVFCAVLANIAAIARETPPVKNPDL
jgi:O-antigen ligase